MEIGFPSKEEGGPQNKQEIEYPRYHKQSTIPNKKQHT